MHMIVPIVLVVSNNVRRSGRPYGEHCQDDLKRPRRLRRPRSLTGIEFYPDDRDDQVNFWSDHMKTLSADDWDDRNDLRLSQKPSAILIKKKFGLDAAEVERKIKQKCSPRVGAILGRYLNKKKSVPSSFRGDVTISSWNSSTPREKADGKTRGSLYN